MGPLKGIKVIEMAGIGPGPFCAMMLADMGADVVRIDRRKGSEEIPRKGSRAGQVTAISLSLALPHDNAPLQAAHWPKFSLRAHTPPQVSVAPSASSAPLVRADARLDRAGTSLISSGVLFVPPTFHSVDGVFDLLVFFHGNAELVVQSAAAANLDALVYVVNAGTGSGAYERHYAMAAMFPYELQRVVDAVTSRGLQGARLGRLAFGAWSAGYGALLRLLTQENARSRASAVLLADALHSNLKEDGSRTVDLERMAPFVDFAKEAASGDKLFVMTHSEVNEFRYATTTETSDALIAAVGAYRSRAADWPDRPSFPLARQVMTTPRWLEQHSEAHKGNFHVRGYRGYREDDHIAHLAQISMTLFADLVRYWHPPKRKRWR